jgi:hypothetical protein
MCHSNDRISSTGIATSAAGGSTARGCSGDSWGGRGLFYPDAAIGGGFTGLSDNGQSKAGITSEGVRILVSRASSSFTCASVPQSNVFVSLGNVALDYEVGANAFLLEVTVSDGEIESQPASLVVLVNDVNEAPYFEDDTLAMSIVENLKGPLSMALKAVDPEGALLSYSLEDDYGGKFFIGADGAIVVEVPLDYEEAATYELKVLVRDGRYSAVATVTLTVTNVNEPPVWEAVSFELPENTPPSTNVGTSLQAEDPEGETLAFSITSGQSGSFGVSSSGQIFVGDAADLDYESESEHVVRAPTRRRNSDPGWVCGFGV